MLSAYYDRTCDSHDLFDKYEISQDESYEKHLNKYNVINLDISGFISTAVQMGKPISSVPATITNSLLDELKKLSPGLSSATNLSDGLLNLVRSTGTKIVFVIDE